jgi:AcrR family transcriptional regulator
MLLKQDQPTHKIDPRIKRTQQVLVQAFVDLIKEKGFQAISVQDITARADINRATFYAHFPDKYALLDYYIREDFRQEINKRMLHACQYSPENLRLLIIAVCEFITTTHSHCVPAQNKFETSIEAEIKEQIYCLILNWLQQAGGDASPELAATAASWAIYGLASQWSHAKKGASAEEFADQVLPLVEANLNLTVVPGD